MSDETFTSTAHALFRLKVTKNKNNINYLIRWWRHRRQRSRQVRTGDRCPPSHEGCKPQASCWAFRFIFSGDFAFLCSTNTEIDGSKGHQSYMRTFWSLIPGSSKWSIFAIFTTQHFSHFRSFDDKSLEDRLASWSKNPCYLRPHLLYGFSYTIFRSWEKFIFYRWRWL